MLQTERLIETTLLTIPIIVKKKILKPHFNFLSCNKSQLIPPTQVKSWECWSSFDFPIRREKQKIIKSEKLICKRTRIWLLMLWHVVLKTAGSGQLGTSGWWRGEKNIWGGYKLLCFFMFTCNPLKLGFSQQWWGGGGQKREQLNWSSKEYSFATGLKG